MANYQVTASKLHELEEHVRAVKEAHKEELTPLETEVDKLRDQLLNQLRDERLKSVKLEDGDMYIRYTHPVFKITDDDRAMNWAKRNKCIRIDKTAANKLLLRTPKVPAGWEQEDIESLRITRAPQEQS